MTDALKVRDYTATREEKPPIPVYFAGPIDYIEHRSPGEHRRDNWRHRFFDTIGQIEVLCPTCMNEPRITHVHAMEGCAPDCRIPMTTPRTVLEVMTVNRAAMRRARFMVAYFPGDVATFGTPVEVHEWATTSFAMSRDPGILIHPATPGVFVRTLMIHNDLVVVRTFEEARSWLLRQL
jgi:hypothetical protein